MDDLLEDEAKVCDLSSAAERPDKDRLRRLHCPHVLLVAEGCGPQDLVQILSAGVQVESIRVLLQILKEGPLHKLEDQIPATPTLPHFQEVHQVAVTQLLQREKDESAEMKTAFSSQVSKGL